jgi:hypothetical protein
MATVQLSLRQGSQDICLSNEVSVNIQFCYENETLGSPRKLYNVEPQ